MTDKIGLVILAAGKGTRLNLDLPKALCPAQGKTLIDYVLAAGFGLQEALSKSVEVNVVIGHLKEKLSEHFKQNYLGNAVKTVIQKEQKGTADALKAYFAASPHHWNYDYTVILCADTPLVTTELLVNLLKELKENSLDAVAATFTAENPFGYGRIIRGSTGFSIVEEKDASDELRKIHEVNSALYVAKTSYLKGVLASIDSNNKAGEFYLTDMFKATAKVRAIHFEDASYFMGVNTLQQLEEVSLELQKRKISSLQSAGVIFKNSRSCYVEDEVSIEPGTIIWPNVSLYGNTTIGRECIIEAGTVIKNSSLSERVTILANSYLESAVVEPGCSIGPSARLRPGTKLEKECKIGNFVEIKNSHLKSGVKVSHLSYVGDAEIGHNTNIGCGFITCNYDGANKHKTVIGDNCFVGSDCQMIAPVTLGNEVYIGSGSTINKNVPSGAFAIARERQVTKEGMAKRFIQTKKET